MKYPFNDEYMIYDYEEHRYILTPQAVLDKLNIDLAERLNVGGQSNNERASNMFLEEISNIVYSAIYDYSSQVPIIEYQLAKYPSARKRIMKAMLKQVDYALVNGVLNQYSGVNLQKNTIIDNISDRYLAPLSKSELLKPLDESGQPILYCGKYSIVFKPKYEEEGY